MKLENRFTVPVPRAQAWDVLLDVERITPCLPGATLLTHDGDDFTGKVKVKLGPINLTYGGKATFASLDKEAGIVVIDAAGKETRGTGTAKATITCRLVDRGASTDIEVDTDLAITGKPAQFGRSLLADVSAKLIDQFAACLAEEIEQGTPTDQALEPIGAGPAAEPNDEPETAAPPSSGASDPEADAPGAEPPAPPRAPAPVRTRPSADAIDLLDTAGAPVLKRLAPVLAALLLLVLVVRRLRR